MSAPRVTPTEALVRALGVHIVEVEDLGGQCAVWSPLSKTLAVCEHLCGRRREKALNDVLERIPSGESW